MAHGYLLLIAICLFVSGASSAIVVRDYSGEEMRRLFPGQEEMCGFTCDAEGKCFCMCGPIEMFTQKDN